MNHHNCTVCAIKRCQDQHFVLTGLHCIRMQHDILLLENDPSAHTARALKALFTKNSTSAVGVLSASAVASQTEVALVKQAGEICKFTKLNGARSLP